MRDAKENSALKNRLQELKEANELEKKQLESQVSTVIHSQAGHIAAQRQKITMLQSALQDELAMSQNRIAEQVDFLIGRSICTCSNNKLRLWIAGS